MALNSCNQTDVVLRPLSSLLIDVLCTFVIVAVSSNYFCVCVEDESSVIDLSSQLEADSVFSQMQGDLDQQRLLGERPVPSIDPFLVREIHNKER